MVFYTWSLYIFSELQQFLVLRKMLSRQGKLLSETNAVQYRALIGALTVVSLKNYFFMWNVGLIVKDFNHIFSFLTYLMKLFICGLRFPQGKGVGV